MSHTCFICYKEYKYRRNLIRHIKEHHAGLEAYDCTEPNCNSTFIRRSYLFVHLTSIHNINEEIARAKSISAERKSRKGNQYYDEVSEDDSILDLINEAIEKEKQKGVPSMSTEEFLNSLEDISDDEITEQDTLGEDCVNGDNRSVGVNSLTNTSSCGSSYQDSDSDVNDNNSETIIISDDDSDDVNDDSQLVTIGNSVVQQTVILTLQRTVTNINGQTYVSDVNISHDVYEHIIN